MVHVDRVTNASLVMHAIEVLPTRNEDWTRRIFVDYWYLKEAPKDSGMGELRHHAEGVELRGIEPLTFSLRTKRSTN